MAYHWINTGEYPAKTAIIIMLISIVVGLAFSAMTAQFLYAAITGLLPRWASDPDADDPERLNRKFWKVFLAFVLFSCAAILCIGIRVLFSLR
jgi:ABC-type antimicrobial peptide transport system permease subunit